MKIIGDHSSKRMTVAAASFLIVGAAVLLPWRLTAQEPAAAGEKTTRIAAEESPAQAPASRIIRRQIPGGGTSADTSGTVSGTSGSGIPRVSRPSTTYEPPPRPTMPPPPTELAPARFEAIVYEVQVPRNRIADLDAQTLEASAATPQSLLKALGEFGETRILYKINQPVNLYVESIVLKSTEPIIDLQKEPSMSLTRATSYISVGFDVNISAAVLRPSGQKDGLIVQTVFQLKALSDVDISSTIKSPRILDLKLSRSETVKFGKPTVLLNVSAPDAGGNALPLAYVICYVFKEIKP